MLAASEVLRASSDGAQIHRACSHAHRDERQHHDPERPSIAPNGRRRASLICKCSKKVTNTKHTTREKGEWARTVSIAEVAKKRHGQVHGDLGGYRNSVDLELGIVKAGQEEVAIEGVSCDGASAKTGQYLVPHPVISNTANWQRRAYQLKMAHAKLRYRVTARLILRLSLSIMPSTTSLSKLSSSNRCGPECSEPSLLGAVFLLLSKSSLSILPVALRLELRDRIVGYGNLVIISGCRSIR